MNEDRLRLIKLIEHWIEHNDEHGKRFSEEAEKTGLKSVAVEMRKAAKASGKVSGDLLNALKLLREME
ncbi:hypothetical protein E4H04_03220 [Candidatus Bathyarchaeota archaeon]|nr:MAG: hypothetical protein E4H04_03220 [Candidatus Bathyarchaeota archaeon]